MGVVVVTTPCSIAMRSVVWVASLSRRTKTRRAVAALLEAGHARPTRRPGDHVLQGEGLGCQGAVAEGDPDLTAGHFADAGHGPVADAVREGAAEGGQVGVCQPADVVGG